MENKLSTTWIVPYDLNMLISCITRLNTVNTGIVDVVEIKKQLVQLADIFADNKVPLIHSQSEHIEQLQIQWKYIIGLLYSIIWKYPDIDDLLRWFLSWASSYIKRIDKIWKDWFQEVFVTSWRIEEILQSKWLFEHGMWILENELKEWGGQKKHPDILSFSNCINIAEIQRLVVLSIQDLFELEQSSINYIHEDNPERHKLFWNKNNAGVNYILPSYRLSDYLSFDFPHNATHLIHLSNIPYGTDAYNDQIEQRSFFEALAVLSEHYALKTLIKKKEFSDDIYECIESIDKKNISRDQLRDFMVADRIFEFRLRAARLLWDLLTVNGYSFDESVKEVMSLFEIDEETAKWEIKKYYAQTGLGGIYTYWYLRLLEQKIENPADIIGVKNPHRTWESFLSIK